MEWWHWLLLGLVLVALEMAASGGFYVIFFGLAALVIGGLHLFDIAGPIWFQFLMFSALAVVSLLLFRGPFLRSMGLDRPSVDVDSMIGDLAVPLEDIPAGTVGRAELRGTVWSARNHTPALLTRGQRCVVVRVERLTIVLEPEGAR